MIYPHVLNRGGRGAGARSEAASEGRGREGDPKQCGGVALGESRRLGANGENCCQGGSSGAPIYSEMGVTTRGHLLRDRKRGIYIATERGKSGDL